MRPKTLVPLPNGKRTGILYDSDTPEHATVQVKARVIVTDDPGWIIHIKIWSDADGGWAFSQLAIDPDTHAILAHARGDNESKSWEYLQRQLRIAGYTV